jgi:DNA topoisomerase-2
MTEIRVEVNREENRISVWNNGLGIPIEIHKEEKIYVPEMIFGHLLTSSNYDDEEEKLFGGRNGYGAKLCNIFSTEFTVRTADKDRQLKYEQVFNDNMSKKKAPKITKNSKGEEYTEIIFKPDLSKFNLTELSEDFEKLIQKRAYDLAGCVKRDKKENFRVKFNKQRIPIKDFENYTKLYAESTEAASTGEDEEKSTNNKIYFDTWSDNERWQVGFSVSDGQFSQAS